MKLICRAAVFAANFSVILLINAEGEELSPVPVYGREEEGQDSVEAAEERVKSLAGGASIITPDLWTGRTRQPEEIFRFDPGVNVRSRGLASDSRLSIRGSGIQRRFGDRGVSLLLDGIRANDADGSFYFRAIDPLSINHVEVYRGANGLAYGGSQLGGAVNIVQKNGLNAAGTSLLAEYGSYESYRGAIQHGGSNKRWDWFLGYTYAETGGYREQTSAENHHFTANVGYHWSDRAVTRFYLLGSDSDGELAGSLTPGQFQENPRQISPRRDPDADRDLVTIRVGQRTEWESESGSWSFYTNYQYLDFDHLINRGGPFLFNRLIDYVSDGFQTGIHGEEEGRLFGLENTVRFDAHYNYGRQDEGGFGGFVRTPVRPAPAIDRVNTASNFQAYLENDLTFAPGHHLILGGGWVRGDRQVRIGSGDEQSTQNAVDESYDDFVYRIGYLYELNEKTQFFVNYSQNFEIPAFSEATEDNGSLDPQRAQTFEIGTRFEHDFLKGELTYYRSAIEDEFIFEQVAADGPSTLTNLDGIHQGVEAALRIDLTNLVSDGSGPRLQLDQVYQWNDFEIDAGSDRGNRLPGVSEHVYRGRLRLEDRDARWNVSLAAEWLPEGFVVDNANQNKTDGFAVWRLAGEYQVNDGLTLYGGVDNLFDKTFVNNVVVNPDGDAFINPGDGRAIYFGLKMEW